MQYNLSHPLLFLLQSGLNIDVFTDEQIKFGSYVRSEFTNIYMRFDAHGYKNVFDMQIFDICKYSI